MNHKAIFPLLFILCFFNNCTSDKADNDILDYSTISLSSMEMEFSITESESYLPAQLTRVMVNEEGYILVTQRAPKSIHQFDSLGNYMAQIARPGRGPGELSQYANPHFRGNILFMSNNNGMITEYRQNDLNLFEHHTDHNYRLPGPLSGVRSPNGFQEFYVSEDSVDYPFTVIPPEFTTDLIHLVKVTDDSLQIQEQVLSIQKHSYYLELTNNGNTMSHYFLPYRYSDYLNVLPGEKTLVLRPSSSAIEIYDKEFNLEHKVVLNIKERKVTEKDMEYHFPENTSSEKRDRRSLIKDVKPPFTRVLMDNKDRFWLFTDETEAGKEYVILNYSGQAIGRILFPSHLLLNTIRDDRIYLINRENPSVDVYSIKV